MTKTDFLAALEEMLNAAKGSLHGTENLVDMSEWDSLAIVCFVALADKEAGVSVPPQDLEKCKTVNDLYDAVIKAKGQA